MYYSTILIELTFSFGPLTLPAVTLGTPSAISPPTYFGLCGVLVLAAVLVASYFPATHSIRRS